MSTTFQLSDKGGETGQAILLIKVEAPDEVSPEIAFGVFVQAVAEAGLTDRIDNFDALKKAVEAAKAGLGATPVEPAAPAVVTQGPWGQPPVPPMQPAPQLPAAAQAAPVTGAPPLCDHGMPREFISGITKSGKNAGKPWKAWACPLPREQQCEKEWIRD